ncbi:TetR/AcrR family transcriptional regulator [Enhygromyxa salina]|uniref:Fatty acid metabolism regulator protein n=1 Tax=Enhygromyxa salina TaxID=215803 RepID=A0A2S9YPF4_9BACT|nr:TetR/AcrR family transcriptional regulator [Enhygromyxa salina]PRQ06967.1 Fatty acid metabolism regulator protein [Enhygromyxa salina]
MPKPTFLNLPDEKRKRITELALDEFSTYPYRQASLSRIVSRAGIAKGSMYQYFENKLDLYRWLVTDELEARRTQWLENDSQQHAQADDAEASGPREVLGLFAGLERLVMTRIGFMLAHPRLARLAASAMEPSADDELRELHGALWRRQIDDLAARLSEARHTGEVRQNIDPRTAAHLIDALILRGTTNAVLERLGVDAHELLTKPDAGAELAESEWRGLVRDAMRLIRGGIEATAPLQAAQGSNGSHDDDVDTRLRPIARPNIEWRASHEGG